MNAIVAEVKSRGRVTFAEFMELALYHPSAGYYTRPRRGPGPAGRGGDFLTAPTADPLFARTLARLLTDLATGVGERLTFVELGAGEGMLLAELKAALGDRAPEVVRRVVAVEGAAWARKRLAARWPGAEAVERFAGVSRPAGPVLLFASEFYDALPVHRVTMRRVGGLPALREYYVEVGARERLRWTLAEPSTPELEGYLAEHAVALEEDQIAEVRPRVARMHAEHLAWCGKNALALIVDYGHPARKLYNARARRHGSLAGYRAHTLVADVLSRPGATDLTAHVNLDDLQHAAAAMGWDRGMVRALGSFLALHGAMEHLPAGVAGGAPLTATEWAELAAAKRLLLPSGMGTDLKVLAQGRGPLWQLYLRLAAPPPAEA
jgi:SAM-dependent MidA family methyltransferase